MAAAGVTLGLTLLGTVTHAQVNMTSTLTPPSVGYYDQSYLPGVVVEGTDTIGSPFTTSGANDASTYASYPDRTSKAQSFTTGSNPAGYKFNSFTFQQADGGPAGTWLSNGTFFLLNNGDTVSVRFGSLPAGPTGAYNSILTTSATYTGPTYNTGSTTSALGVYFNFDFSGANITLQPNTTYFVEIMPATGSDHFELNNTSTNPSSSTFPPLYTKGAALVGNTTAALDATGTFTVPAAGGEFAFDASVTPVGAPAVVATANPVNATNLQSFTITATVTPGAGTVTGVTVDLTPIGGSVSSLVHSSGNIYTGTFTVPAGAPLGTTNLVVTATDSQPLLGQTSVGFTVYTPTSPQETANLLISPASEYTEVGLVASFVSSFSGSLPLAYQWQYSSDGSTFVNIPSSSNPTATNSTLVLSNVATSATGYYQVVVTNSYGSLTSEYAYLSVQPTVPNYVWQYPVSMGSLTADQVLTNFPGTFIAGAMVAQNGGSPITVTDGGSDTPIVFAGAGAWATLTGGNGYTATAITNSGTINNANFATVLGDKYYDTPAAVGYHSITLNGLIVGKKYSVQLFALDDGSYTPPDSQRQVTFQDPNDYLDMSTIFTMDQNAYVVGTFTAASASQVIQENLTSDYGNINGLILRAVGWTPAPYFTTDPAAFTANYGNTSVSLTAVAAGDATITNPTITYQWQAGPVGGPYTNLVAGAKYVGVTTTNLVVNNLNTHDSAPVYVLAASNGGGTTLSSPATLQVIVLPTPPAGSYAAYALSNGPAGFWPLSEQGDPTTGTLLALDYSGNEFNGVYGLGSQTWTNGIYSPQPPAFAGFAVDQGALELPSGATNAVVTLPTMNLQANITNRTICMWIYPQSQPPNAAGLLLNRGGSDGTSGLSFTDNEQGNDVNGNPSTALGYHWNDDNANAYAWNTGLYPPIGSWSFVTLVVTVSNAVLYLDYQDNNGVYHLSTVTNNVTAGTGGWFSGGTTYIGNDPTYTTRVFPGIISGVGLYTTALSASQITAMYQAGLGLAGFPPSIASQPLPVDTFLGSSATLSVNVVGTAPFAYQWQLSGTNLPNNANFSGVTSNTLTITGVTLNDVGNYSVVITNLFGTATSTTASLTILPPALVGQWLNGASTNLVDESGYSPAGTHDLYTVGAGNFVFTNDVPPHQTGQSIWFYNGDTALAVSNSSTLDANYTNTYDAPLQDNMTVLFWAKGYPATWHYWVSKNGDSGTPNSGWTLRDYGANTNYPCYTLRETGSPGKATLGTSGDDMGSSVPSNDGQWHQYAGTFSAITGIRSLYVDGVLTAQQTNNIPFNPATLEHLVIGGIDPSPGNSFASFLSGEIYNVQIYNYALSQAAISNSVGNLAPEIEGLATNDVVYATTLVQLQPAGILGTGPFGYQWQFNGSNLSDNGVYTGSQSNVLSIVASAATAGVYDLVVTNLYGTTISSNVTVVVVPENLVGEWFTNSTLNDVSGYSPAGLHTGVPVGATAYVFTNDVPTFRTGQALYLNAGTTAIAITNSSTFDNNYANTYDDQFTNAFSIAFWAKGFPGQWNYLVSKNGDSPTPTAGWTLRNNGAAASPSGGYGNASWTMRSPSGTLVLGADSYGSTDDMGTSTANYADGNWHHYVGTYQKGGSRCLYVDGALVAQENNEGAFNLAAYSHLVIGGIDKSPGNTFGTYLTAKFYDVRLYNYPLSSNAVAALVAPPAGTPPTVLSQVASQVNTYAGYTVNLTVNAGGSATLTNQWAFNGTALANGTYGGAVVSGAGTTNLTIANVTTAFQGTFTFNQTNAFGSLSTNVTLTVTPLSTFEASGSYAAAIAALTPLGFWPLNDLGNPATQPVKALDVSGNGLNGTYGASSIDSFYGALSPQPPAYPGFTAGQGALGTFQAVAASAVTLPALNLYTNNVTFATWIFPTNNANTSAGLIFNRGGSDTADGFGFSGTRNGLGMPGLGYTWNNNASITYNYNSALYPPTNVWSYVALVITPTNANFYLDYQDVNGIYHQQSSVFTITNHIKESFYGGTIQIGADSTSSGRVFNGRISEAAVLNQSLSAAQITNLYLAGVGLSAFPAQIATPPAPATAFTAPGDQTTQTIQFSVTAVGTGPFTYQWSYAGTPLANTTTYSGVTSNVLTVVTTGATAASVAGNYSVLVANSFSSTNSVPVALNLVTLPSLPAHALVGQWFGGASNFKDASGYSPAGSHDGYIVPSGNLSWALTNDVPPGRTGVSFWTYTNVCGLAISNSSTLDANYTSTFDSITNAFTVTLWARGFPGQWNSFVSKFGETENGWQVRDLGSQPYGGILPTSYGAPSFTVRDNNAGSLLMGVSAGDDMGVTNRISDGNWHFYAGVFNALTGIRSLYLDGVVVAQETNNNPCIPALPEHLVIAGKDSSPGNSFGSFSALEIYDVRLYNYDLNQSQVTQVQTPPPQVPTLTSSYANGQYVLTWSNGTLQTTTNLLSGWTPVTTSSPYTIPVSTTNKQVFFRVSNP